MARLIRLILIVGLLMALMPAVSVVANAPKPPVPNTAPPPFPNCEPFVAGTPSGPQVYLICLPWPSPPTNFDLVIFAHGYVAPNEPLTAYLTQLVLPDGNTIPGIANGLGFAFATTSYRKNGLAVKEGIDDVAQLAAFFKANVGAPKHIYLIGASEGGLVTTLSIEKRADLYTGGLAMCGPIGDFRSQINYWGDFRVLFDYFFPAYPIPNSPININETLVWPNWASMSQAIGAAVFTGGHTTEQLLRTSRAPIDLSDPQSVISTTIGILSYNVFATNEGIVELNGQPFDNWNRWYMGSDNDWLLNRSVQRFHADPAAINQINTYYQTSGRLSKPLITLHTTGDPIVPYWHEPLYTAKTLLSGSLLEHINIPIVRYGHCNFKSSEALFAFVLLVLRSGLKLDNPEKVLTTDTARTEFKALMQQYKSEIEGSR